MKRLCNNQWSIKKFNEKDALEVKKIYNHYIDKRSEFIKIHNSK